MFSGEILGLKTDIMLLNAPWHAITKIKCLEEWQSAFKLIKHFLIILNYQIIHLTFVIKILNKMENNRKIDTYLTDLSFRSNFNKI